MNLYAEQIQLVTIINNHVDKYPDTDRGNEQLLTTIYDYMDAFKRVMESTTTVQMDHLSLQYLGFCRSGKLLETIAQGISDGSIVVFKAH